MAEYKVIYRDEHPGWQPGCPARLTAVQVARNTQSGTCYLQARVDNLLAQPIEALEVVFDVASPEGTSRVTVELFDAGIAPATTAALPPQLLGCHEVSGVTATVVRVNDARDFAAPAPLPAATPLALSEKAAAELHAEAPQLPAHLVCHQEHDGWWLCCCGRLNVGHEACGSCGTDVNVLAALEDEAALERRANEKTLEAARTSIASESIAQVEAALKELSELGDFGDAAALTEQGAKHLADLQAKKAETDAAAKRRNKKIGIGVGIVAAVALAAYLVVGVALPQMRQAKVNELIEAGQYDELVKMYDTSELADLAHRLYEEGNTEAAIEINKANLERVAENNGTSIDSDFTAKVSADNGTATVKFHYTGSSPEDHTLLVTWRRQDNGLILKRFNLTPLDNDEHETSYAPSSENPNIRVVVLLDGTAVYSEDVNF